MKFITNKAIQFIFFGNYFYGICAIALSVEASLQQGHALSSVSYYILTFAVTLVYYTKASLMTESSADTPSIRSHWYFHHKKLLLRTQFVFGVVIAFILLLYLKNNFHQITLFSLFEWITLLIFPSVALFYYGLELKLFKTFNLRNIGWLKPLVIGFTWAGLTTIYPIFYDAILNHTHYLPDSVAGFLFLKNCMFITILCILFDIKDYAMDYNAQLKTIVIKIGLRKTLFYLIIPLCLIGLSSFYFFAMLHHFSLVRIIINTVPFLLITLVAYSMSSRRTIFYYLIVIDGLMLIKALCGIAASLLVFHIN